MAVTLTQLHAFLTVVRRGSVTAAAKELVDQGAATSLDAALALEREAVAMLFATDDRVEGVAAFVERRTPTFRGR